jgi:hypothetical protein
MRTVLFLTLIGTAFPAEGPFGTWKGKNLIVRVEPHPKGKVLTIDRIEKDGRTTSSSTVLYLDGAPRDFRDFECSGTQSSRRVDGQTAEILRKCEAGAWTRLVLRTSAKAAQLVLETTEQHADGRRVEWRLVLEKQ